MGYHTATLVGEALSQYAPRTDHYACSDGTYLLVHMWAEVPPPDLVDANGAPVVLLPSHEPRNTEVFLADENAVVLDADGNPANGMTPLLRCDGPVPAAEALAQLGYALEEGADGE